MLGGSKYDVVVVVLVVGYGYVWWKGWKLPNLMFATRRSLSEPTTKRAKELENVYSSISCLQTTKRYLSSKIDRVDSSLNEAGELTAATREEVYELRGDMKVVGGDVRSVCHAVQTLETKLNRIEMNQNYTVENAAQLVDFAWNLENARTEEHIQVLPSSSSRPALELPETKAASVSKRHVQSAVPAFGLKDHHEFSNAEDPSEDPAASIGIHVTEDTNPNNKFWFAAAIEYNLNSD